MSETTQAEQIDELFKRTEGILEVIKLMEQSLIHLIDVVEKLEKRDVS